MVLSVDEEKELEVVLHWPYIDPNSLSDTDEERLREVFKRMQRAQSKATVRDIFDHLERLHPDEKRLRDWTRKRITDIAAKYFPAGEAGLT